MSEHKKNPDKIGALWEKDSARGPYMSGEVEIDGVKTRLVVFRNSYKEKDTQPDWNIMKSKPREGGDRQPAQQSSPQQPQTNSYHPVADVDDSSVPF
jgi:hypothetical protein